MNSNRHSRRNKGMILTLAIILLFIGIYFTTTNAYTLLKGYALYKWDKKETAVTTSQEKREVAEQQELYPTRPEKGDMIGDLYIPKLDSTLPIYHGTDEDELEKGVGHYAGSVLPGETDNSVLSGHRDTVFRKLGEVGEGDLLITNTEAGTFTFKVRKVRIVDADDRTVIVPKPKATLTVTTCYPFSYIGNAPERYVLIADLIETEVSK
ncbi:class D sortase [Peribacillus asahii]|uniref:class D sortase n=1 Tax=Peribacillus asahii TaxID=228899 RepID=UPI00338F5E1D